jgi:hypothetical protein
LNDIFKFPLLARIQERLYPRNRLSRCVFEIVNFSASSVLSKGLLFLFPNTVSTDPFKNPTFYQLIEGPVVALSRDDCKLVVKKHEL